MDRAAQESQVFLLPLIVDLREKDRRKQGEFVEKYLRKGTKVLLEGEIQQNNYTNKDGQEVRSYQIITNNIEFAESKNASQAGGGDYSQGPSTDAGSDFLNIPDNVDEQLPF